MLWFITSNTSAQRVKARFTMMVSIDNLWYLDLKRNKTFEFYHWSGFGGSYLVKEGGYELNGEELILNFPTSENPDSIKNTVKRGYSLESKYYLTEVKLKRGEELTTFRKCKRFSFLGKKYLVLSYGPFDESKLNKWAF